MECMIPGRSSGGSGCCGTLSHQWLGLLLGDGELEEVCEEEWEKEEHEVEDMEEEVQEGSGMRKREEDHRRRWFIQAKTLMGHEKGILASA